MISLPLVIRLLRLAAARRSIAAVEFALLAPVFIIVLAGTVDLGFAIYTWSRLQGALAAGANYALMNPGAVNHTSAATLAQKLSTLVANSNTNAGDAPATVTVTVNNGPWNTATPTRSNPGYSLTYTTGGNGDECGQLLLPFGFALQLDLGKLGHLWQCLLGSQSCRAVRDDCGEL